MVIVSLHPDSFKDLSSFIAWLPADQPDGKAGSAAALLANLAQASGAALQVRKEKNRKDYTFWCLFNEKPSIVLGCPSVLHASLLSKTSPQCRNAFLLSPSVSEFRFPVQG